MNNKEIGEKIRNLRRKKGISQQELADEVGYTSKVAISRIENGQINIPMDKLAKIANVLDAHVSDLLYDKPYTTVRSTLFTFDTSRLSEGHQRELQRIAEVFERTELWQKQSGMEDDGDSGLHATESRDPFPVQPMDAKAEPKSRNAPEDTADYLIYPASETRGDDISKN